MAGVLFWEKATVVTAPDPPVRRRITLIEVGILAALATLFLAILIPVLRDTTIDPKMADDLRDVQDAVRRFHFDTDAYPTFGPALTDEPSSKPWNPGGLPAKDSLPAFAGINFDADAVRKDNQRTVKLYQDYLSNLPRYPGDFAQDSARRWRVDAGGNVSIELDGRSY